MRKTAGAFPVAWTMVLTLLAFLFAAGIAHADSLDCGTRIISSGDSKVEVLLKCGEPFFQEVVGERKIVRRWMGIYMGSKTVLIEKWTYNLGSNRFLRILTFEGGELKKIETGDKP